MVSASRWAPDWVKWAIRPSSPTGRMAASGRVSAGPVRFSVDANGRGGPEGHSAPGSDGHGDQVGSGLVGAGQVRVRRQRQVLPRREDRDEPGGGRLGRGHVHDDGDGIGRYPGHAGDLDVDRLARLHEALRPVPRMVGPGVEEALGREGHEAGGPVHGVETGDSLGQPGREQLVLAGLVAIGGDRHPGSRGIDGDVAHQPLAGVAVVELHVDRCGVEVETLSTV